MLPSQFPRYIAPDFLQYLSRNPNRTTQNKTKGKNFMRNQNPLTKRAVLFAVLLTLGATLVQADILPGASVSFAPVGITMNQTARLNLVNVGVPNGMLISWRFIDASGITLAQSTVILPLGKIVSVDYRRHGDPLPAKNDSSELMRGEVRAQVEIVSAGIPSESLRRSLEVFNNDTGATTVCMVGTGL
jgi:hypothetical protein